MISRQSSPVESSDMASPKTILLLYVSVGYGHRRAALALQTALNRADPLYRTACLDLLELWSPWVGRLICRLYRGLTKTAPRIWSYLYDRAGFKERFSPLFALVYGLCQNRVRLLLEEFSPAVVVCTQAFPSSVVSVYKARSGKAIPLVAVPTDYTVHAYWLDEQVDLYLAPSEESRDRMVRRGVDPARVKVVGIPVNPGFSRRHDRVGLGEKYGLAPATPTVLLMGGGEGSVSLERLIVALDRKPGTFQMAAVSGRNLSLHVHLCRLRSKLAHRLKVFSFTDSVDELMEVSDLIVTKPGGLTTAEALAKELPMILIDPLPGQEELNARFLQGRGVAIRAGDHNRAATLVARMLNGGGDLKRLREAIREMKRPSSSTIAARLILQTVNGHVLSP